MAVKAALRHTATPDGYEYAAGLATYQSVSRMVHRQKEYTLHGTQPNVQYEEIIYAEAVGRRHHYQCPGRRSAVFDCAVIRYMAVCGPPMK